MGLLLATVLTIAVTLLILFLLGRKYPAGRTMGPGPTAPSADRVTAAKAERENPGLVHEDVRQMLAAQNELRRRRGAAEMSESDLRSAVAEDERHRSRGRGPFGLD